MEGVITLAASKLGYSSLREEQMKAIASFASGNDVLFCYLLVLGKHCVILCYQYSLIY